MQAKINPMATLYNDSHTVLHMPLFSHTEIKRGHLSLTCIRADNQTVKIRGKWEVALAIMVWHRMTVAQRTMMQAWMVNMYQQA